MSPLIVPPDEEITAFYQQWFQDNYCLPPSAKASATAVLAIKAAFEHFAAPAGDQACSL